MWNSELKLLKFVSYRGHPTGGSWVYYSGNRWKFGRPKFIDLMEEKEIDLFFLDTSSGGTSIDMYLQKYYNDVDLDIGDLYSKMLDKYKIRLGSTMPFQIYIYDYEGTDTEYTFIPAPSSATSKKRKK